MSNFGRNSLDRRILLKIPAAELLPPMPGLFTKLIDHLDKQAFAKALKQTFGGIYCINLDHSTERWAETHQHFRDFGLGELVQRHSATFLKEDPRYRELERLQNGKYSILSCCGCAMSHRNIIAEAKAQNLDSVLVFEDDIKILSPNHQAVPAALQELRKRDWDIFYLGATYNKPLVRVTDALLHAPEGAHATHAIAYHSRVYDQILEAIPEDPLEFINAKRFEVDAIDVWLQSAGIIEGDVYCTDPITVVQRSGASNIDQTEFIDFEKFHLDLFERNRPPK